VDGDVLLGGQLGDPGHREPDDRDPQATLPDPGAPRLGQGGQPGGVRRPYVHVREWPERRRCRDVLAYASSAQARLVNGTRRIRRSGELTGLIIM
jgi:hypothetical protein